MRFDQVPFDIPECPVPMIVGSRIYQCHPALSIFEIDYTPRSHEETEQAFKTGAVCLCNWADELVLADGRNLLISAYHHEIYPRFVHLRGEAEEDLHEFLIHRHRGRPQLSADQRLMRIAVAMRDARRFRSARRPFSLSPHLSELTSQDANDYQYAEALAESREEELIQAVLQGELSLSGAYAANLQENPWDHSHPIDAF